MQKASEASVTVERGETGGTERTVDKIREEARMAKEARLNAECSIEWRERRRARLVEYAR